MFYLTIVRATPNVANVIPYTILLLNCLLFMISRRLVRSIPLLSYRPFNLIIDELISTIELCVQCAELNAVYAKHGSIAYGVSLFLLSCWWSIVFGNAYTTPGYLVEDWLESNGIRQDMCLRLIGQLGAISFSWPLASMYWKYELIEEHTNLLQDCQSSLTTSTLIGALIEFACCALYRVVELSLTRSGLGQQITDVINAAFGSILVVLALEYSGGYMNPVLASSLEYGCRGASNSQHMIVFWLGPLLGHALAKRMYRRAAFRTEKINIKSTKKIKKH